ncbi:MAG: metallophosphoesterase, partial [Candidatus Omnitrophota bacterium]
LGENKLYYSRQNSINIEEGKKYIINVGSVGQPRDGDNRASFCIYDHKEKLVNIYRLEYNIKKCADKILEAGLPAILAERLYVGR